MKEALAKFPWPWLPSLALLIFFGFFVALVFLVTRKEQQPRFETLSQLPLEEGERYE